MKLIINYWRNPSGRAPVENISMRLTVSRKGRRYSPHLKAYRTNGTDSIGVEFRHIEGKLWELKIRTHGNQHRIFYVVLKGSEMVLLHAFLKKTPKTPLSEIETARRRLRQLMEVKNEK